MSWQAARAVLDIDGIKPGHKFVLVAIALRAGTDGRAWPSLARLSADTGFSRSKVQASVAWLVSTGHLQVSHKPGRTLSMALTGPDSGPPTRPDIGPTGPDMQENRSRYRTQKSKEENKKYAATGSTVNGRPPLEGNGHVNGPAPGETWGEYRERGGR